MSLYLGTTPIAVNSSSREIGEIVQSTIPLTDAGLHLLDGSLISGSGSYSAFVTYIAGLVTGYPDLFETEANWQSSVSTYGVCGKFVYDSVNGTVRLPKITGFTEGTIDTTVLGDVTEAGLPNIKGNARCVMDNNNVTGPFYRATTTSDYTLTSGSGWTVGFDASRANSIYGNSTTVQPQTIKVLYYIVIATSTKTSIEVDIDEIATDLNGKADVDLTNVNSSGTSLASGWSMPSSNYINLTLGASGTTYTAPANGWFYAGGSSTGGWVKMVCSGLSLINYIPSGNGSYLAMPAKKGAILTLQYNQTTISDFWFVYAEGENV